MLENDIGYMGIEEVRKTLSVSKSTVYELIKLGAVPAPKKFGRSSKWPRAEIRDLCAKIDAGETVLPSRAARQVSE